MSSDGEVKKLPCEFRLTSLCQDRGLIMSVKGGIRSSN